MPLTSGILGLRVSALCVGIGFQAEHFRAVVKLPSENIVGNGENRAKSQELN